MAKFTISVRRYNHSSVDAPYWQDFETDLAPENSVLDALLFVKDHEDGSVGVTCSCQGAICGSCGMRINGETTLACNTLLRDASASPKSRDGVITLEPMNNMPVVKDLIVDMNAVHWQKIQQITPWLQPEGDPPEREYLVPPETNSDIMQTMVCIQCGCCVSECLSLEVDPLFIGPAAAAKAYRFVGDPRDGKHKERLEALANDPHGIFDCTHCFRCVDACPKGVAPMDQIMRLRRRAIHDHDITDSNNGRRHEEAFVKIIGKKGRNDETKLLMDSFKRTDIRALLKSLPTGLRALVRRKAPLRNMIPGLAHSIPDRKNLKPIYAHAEEHAQELNLYIVGAEELEPSLEELAETDATEETNV